MLTADKKKSHGDTHLIEFTWDNETYTFADILDAAGVLPIPPYLHRETEKSDLQTYQTVFHDSISLSFPNAKKSATK